MKRISKIYKKLLIAVALVCGISSCTDYLTIIPPEKITEEHFWQTKDDVNGVLAKAYLNLLSTDAIQKAIIWGELRAENLTYKESGEEDIKYIVEANLLDENVYCDWAIYYEAIQTASLVIDRAPIVMERDPDFTQGDLDVVLGEMYALRALGHFYLVRAFRDIPLAREVVADDSDMPDYPQVHPLEALNFIMEDLEKAENLVMKSGNFSKPEQNFGRITKNAVLAMKADVNLWRAAFATYYEGKTDLVADGDILKYYDECIGDCRDVIKNMDTAFEESFEGQNTRERYPYNLIQNHGETELKEDEQISTAYNDIFGTMNSRESIFELQVQGDNVKNSHAKGVYYMYGSEDNVGQSKLIVPSGFVGKTYEDDDLRRYSYVYTKSQGDGKNGITYVAKYSAKSSPASDFRKRDEYDANWIVYRKADVLLMLAEALAVRSSSSEEDLAEAFNIAKAINTRSRMDTANMDNPINVDDYTTSSFDRPKVLDLVLDERLRELSFEGKRWFDLVRKALREKSTESIKMVADKLDKDAAAVKTKMSTIDGLFMPIYIDELRFNKLLEQNPVYKNEDSSTEMN